MKSISQYCPYFFKIACIIILFTGCNLLENNEENVEAQKLACWEPDQALLPLWTQLNFSSANAQELFIENGDLFVVAGNSGLYYLEDANPENDWKLLGFELVQGKETSEAGVKNVLVYDNMLLVNLLNPKKVGEEEFEIWRSNDKGVTWFPINATLNSGLRQLTDIDVLAGSPFNSQDLSAISRGEIYFTTDGGQTWEPESGSNFTYQGGVRGYKMVWNSNIRNEAWVLGYVNYFSTKPLLGYSSNFQNEWELSSIPQHNIRDQAFFSDIAFDAINSKLIYLSYLDVKNEVLISEQRGVEWFNGDSVTTILDQQLGEKENEYLTLEAHPKKGCVLYAGEGSSLHISVRKGEQVKTIKNPEELTFYHDLKYNVSTQTLYVLGNSGVYSLQNVY